MRKNILSFFILLFVVLGIFHFQKDFSTIDNRKIQTASKEVLSDRIVEQKAENSVNKEEKLYELIGKDSQSVIDLLGQPTRIDASEYDYDWWIYNKPLSRYCQIGVEDDKVVSVFVMGGDIDIAPFKIGQRLDAVKDIIDISNKVAFEVDQNLFQFELTEEEMNTVPLIQYKDVWAQINVDKFNKKISSIRFLDAKTLVKIRPYELVYRGELISAQEINPERWDEIEKGKALQILDMTNIIRKQYGLSPVTWDESTAVVAYSHSREMFEEEYFSHSSPKSGDLSNRLLNGGVSFSVAGENIAARYVDAISAVAGWLNSEGHRTTLLNKEFTHLGVGVYEKYYTQNFIKAW